MAMKEGDVGSDTSVSEDCGPTGLYVGDYKRSDPREALLARVKGESQEGMVIVPAALIKQVYRMRVCRSSHVIEWDEDGKLPKPQRLHCVEQAGHDGDHNNGYARWRR